MQYQLLVLSFDLDIAKGILSNKSVLAEIPSPDNMRLNHDYSLWVASPLSNRIFSVDTNSAMTLYLKCSSGGQSITLVIPTNGLTPVDPS